MKKIGGYSQESEKELYANEVQKLENELGRKEQELKDLELEIIVLKSKIYDLIK